MIVKLSLDVAEEPEITWSQVRAIRWMVDYRDTFLLKVYNDRSRNMWSGVVMEHFHAFGA